MDQQIYLLEILSFVSLVSTSSFSAISSCLLLFTTMIF